jgi:hypothetical protein
MNQIWNYLLFWKFIVKFTDLTKYHTFRAASCLINSKRVRWFFLEILKAYGRKSRKFIIAPEMALHWHESHSMIYSFGIGLIRGSYIRCFHLKPQGHVSNRCGAPNQWLFCVWSNFNLINFGKMNPPFRN